MKNRILIYSVLHCFASLLSTLSAVAQDSNYKLGGHYLESIGHDFISYVAAPSKWREDDWMKAVFFAGTTALVYANDKLISDGIQLSKSTGTRDVSNVIEPLGRGYVVMGGIASIYLGGLIFKNDKVQNQSLQALKTTIIASAVVGGIKYISQRARPNQFNDPFYWNPAGKNEYHSFFSGHTTYAFCAAGAISNCTQKKWVRIVAYGLATSVAVSRIHDLKHWPSDVVVGAAFGLTLSNFVFKNENGRH